MNNQLTQTRLPTEINQTIYFTPRTLIYKQKKLLN